MQVPFDSRREASGAEHYLGRWGPGTGVKSGLPEPLKLDRGGMKLYRSAVARYNYLAADRYEIASTTKNCADHDSILAELQQHPTITDASH